MPSLLPNMLVIVYAALCCSRCKSHNNAHENFRHRANGIVLNAIKILTSIARLAVLALTKTGHFHNEKQVSMQIFIADQNRRS